MTSLPWVRTAQVLALVACGACASAAPGSEPAQDAGPWTDDQRAIIDVMERTEEANNAGDVDAWVALFAADAVYMPPGVAAVTTREGLVDVAEAGFRHQADIDIRPLEVVLAGDWAFARTAVSGTVTVNPTGEVVQVDSKQLVVYRRDEDGRWRIARLITNRNG
jgi:uncharacterized protein (TIGR02246 family)